MGFDSVPTQVQHNETLVCWALIGLSYDNLLKACSILITSEAQFKVKRKPLSSE